MPQPQNPVDETRQAIHAQYGGEYRKAARGGKWMSREEAGKLALFAGFLGGMMVVATVFPAAPLWVVGLLGMGTLGSTILSTRTPRCDVAAKQALDRDIDNGKLVARYRKDLLAGPELASLKSKLAGLRALTKSFAKATDMQTAQPVIRTTAAKAAPAPKSE